MFYTTNIKPQQTKQAQNILIKQIKTRDKNETQAGSLEHNRTQLHSIFGKIPDSIMILVNKTVINLQLIQ